MKAVTKLDDITVFGARGHTLTMLRVVEGTGRGKARALIDDIDNGFIHPELNIPVISSDERLRDFPDLPVLLTPGSGALRAKMARRYAQEGAAFATVFYPDALHMDPNVQVGAGCIIAPYTRIGPGTVLGEGVHAFGTIIAHDVEIGAFSTVSIGTQVLGHVIIGREVNIAPGAMIANGTKEKPLRIGDGAVIGVGAVVLRDVPARARMVGNPAMPLEHWAKFNRWLNEA